MTIRVGTLVLLLVSGVVTACSPPSSVSPPDSGTDALAELDADHGGEPAPADASCGAADAGLATVNSGYVALIEEPDTPLGEHSGEIVARFDRAGDEVRASTCVSSTYGACVVWSNCVGGATTCGLPNAGNLAVTGGGLGASPGVTLPPDGLGGGYAPLDVFSQLFADGDVLTVTASGGDIPAFQASVTGPGCVGFASPQTNDAGSMVIPTSQDYDLSWSGGEPGATVVVTLSDSYGAPPIEVDCSFPAAAGNGTVPSQALAPLAGRQGAQVSVHQERSQSFDAGGYAVQIAAANYGGASTDAGPCPENELPVELQ